MKCPRCGREIKDGEAFCTACGHRLESGGYEPHHIPPMPEKKETSAAGKFWRAIGAALLAICVMVGCQSCVMSSYAVSLIDWSGIALPEDEEARVELVNDLTTEALNKAYEEQVLILVVSSLLCVLLLCAFFHLRHKNPAEEMMVHFVHPGRYLTFAVLGTALHIFIVMTISLIPLPEAWLNGLDSQYATLYGNDLWLEILSCAVLVPIVEELVFRGIAMKRLEPVCGRGWAVAITAVLFGLAHGTPIAVGYATVLGVVFALLCSRYQSVIPTVICHMFFNLTSYWLSPLLEKNPMLFMGLYTLSIAAILWCIYRTLVRYPTFTDLASDRKGRIKPINEEEAEIAQRLQELYKEAPEMDPEKLHEELSDLEARFEENRKQHKSKK